MPKTPMSPKQAGILRRLDAVVARLEAIVARMDKRKQGSRA
jgi:hypothetical protein